MRKRAIAGTVAVSLGVLASAGNAWTQEPLDCAAPPTILMIWYYPAAEDTPSTLKVPYGHPGCDATGDQIETTIDWGDGSSGEAIATPKAGERGSWTLSATHTYRDKGRYAIVLRSRNARTGVTREDHGVVANVGPATPKLLSPALRARVGERFVGELATSNRMGGVGELTSRYAATIAWGDGTTSTGNLSIDARGRLVVSGRHTYRRLARGIRLTVAVEDKTIGAVIKLRRGVRLRA